MQDINYLQWSKHKTTGFMEKKISETIKTFGEAFSWFESAFNQYRSHKYLVKVQKHLILENKKSLKDGEAYVIMDFSENYAATCQDDTQQSFFGKNQIGLFTVVSYFGKNCESMSLLIANDDASHSKEQVFYYIRLIVTELKKKYSHLNKIFFVTDGSPTQFKNRYIISSLVSIKEELGVSVQWDFFPTSHGKSPADGLGGTIKRGVGAKVLGGELVYNAANFIDCAKKFCKKTKLYLVTEEHTRETSKKLEKRWKKVKPMNGLRSMHHFRPSTDGKSIEAAVTSKLDGFKNFKI